MERKKEVSRTVIGKVSVSTSGVAAYYSCIISRQK